MITKLFFFLSLKFSVVISGKNNPNILVIIGDDLGWRDVSYHGYDDILTPNIDTLAYQGIILQQYHTDISGTASRASFLTGKYAMRLGLQGPSLRGYEDNGIPLTERLLPMYLKKLDYSTHLVGKWDVGFSRTSYLPTNRGFDSFYGFYTSGIDYYNREHIEPTRENYFGLSFYDDTTPITDESGYITDAFTERAVTIINNHNDSAGPLFLQVSHAAPHVGLGGVPLQAPLELVEANKHIANPARRHYAAMVQSLDKSVGKIILALEEKNILNDTVIVFIVDNGGMSTGDCTERNYASNLPLRGSKSLPWDGAARVPAIIWHSLFQPAVWSGLFHVSDWFPTLITAAGGLPKKGIDGVDHWTSITHRKSSERSELLVTVDGLNNFAAYKFGDYKLVVGKNVKSDGSGFHGSELLEVQSERPDYEASLMSCELAKVLSNISNRPLGMSLVYRKRNATLIEQKVLVEGILCMPTPEKGCLYNLSEDPLEINDIWYKAPSIVKTMTMKLRKFWSEQKPRNIVVDERSKPSLHGYIWTSWTNISDNISSIHLPVPRFPLEISIEEVEYVLSEHMDSFTDRIFSYVKSVRGSVMNSVRRFFN